jgi:hypothetical protein
MKSFDFRFSPGQRQSSIALTDGLLSLGFLPTTGRFSDASLFDAEVRLHVVCTDQIQLAGRFTISHDGSSVEVHGDTINKSDVESAINSLSTIRAAALVDVQEVAMGIYYVYFRDNGAQEPITISEATLGDVSRVTQIQTGTVSLPSIQRINLRIGSLATVTNASFSAIAAGTLSVSTYSTGDATQPQGEEILFSPGMPEGGTFTISTNGGTIWSEPINAPPNAYEIQKALDGLNQGDFTVTRQAGPTLITRLYNGANTPIQVNGDGLRWSEGKTCNLDWSAVLTALDRHYKGDSANVALILETSDDFTDAAEPIREMLRVTMTVPIMGESGTAII